MVIYSLLTLTKLINYKKTKAECIDINSEWFFTSDTANKGYKSKYKFNFNGNEIIASENNYLGEKRKLHNYYVIFFNPNNPIEILSNAQIIIAFFVFGIVIILISII